jgi:hypothetical protein
VGRQRELKEQLDRYDVSRKRREGLGVQYNGTTSFVECAFGRTGYASARRSSASAINCRISSL